jgi:hypothetical protein
MRGPETSEYGGFIREWPEYVFLPIILSFIEVIIISVSYNLTL